MLSLRDEAEHQHRDIGHSLQDTQDRQSWQKKGA